MKRLLIRLSLLATVIGMGTVAVFEAKRMLHHDDSSDELPAITRREEEPRPIPLSPESEAELAANPDSPYAATRHAGPSPAGSLGRAAATGRSAGRLRGRSG